MANLKNVVSSSTAPFEFFVKIVFYIGSYLDLRLFLMGYFGCP